MTVQPNDRKHELAPEFQDEAQQQGKTDRTRENPVRGKDDRTNAGTTEVANKQRTAVDTADTTDTGDRVEGKDARADRGDRAEDRRHTGATDRTDGDNVTAGRADRAADNRAADNRTADNRTADNRTADNRTADNRTADDRAGDRRQAGAAEGRNRHHAGEQDGRPENNAPVAARTRLFEDKDVNRYREQWRELQAGFVDEPRGAVREAEMLVSQMMETLTAQLNEQKRALAGNTDTVDTEQLRVTLQRYRSLFDQMIQV